jgi:hypothetical protein
MKQFVILIILLVFTAASASASASASTSAKIYKWRDENGKLQFSDKPPATAEEITTINIKPNQAIDTNAPNRRAAAAVAAEKERIEEEKKRAEVDERYKKSKTKIFERINEIDKNTKKWREENMEFSERTCKEATRIEQSILKSINNDPYQKMLLSSDLKLIRSEKRVVCP